MHIQMSAKRLAEAREGGRGGGGEHYFIKTIPFSMYPNSKNGHFYPNLGFNYISFGKIVFITLMMVHWWSTEIKIMQFTETLFSMIL